MDDDKEANISIRCSRAFRESLVKAAKAEHRTVTSLIIHVLSEYVRKQQTTIPPHEPQAYRLNEDTVPTHSTKRRK